MKLTAEQYDSKVVIEYERDDLTIDEMRDELLIPLLLAMRYPPDTVSGLFFEGEVGLA